MSRPFQICDFECCYVTNWGNRLSLEFSFERFPAFAAEVHNQRWAMFFFELVNSRFDRSTTSLEVSVKFIVLKCRARDCSTLASILR